MLDEIKMALFAFFVVLLFICGLVTGCWISASAEISARELQSEAVSRGYGEWYPGQGGRATFRWKEGKR